MNLPNAIQPVPYDPAVEVFEDDEARTIAEIEQSMQGISVKTHADSGHATRSVHAKPHGVLVGELTVPAGLPEPYAQGLFAAPGRYDAVLRLSTTPGDVLDDKVSTPRGVGLKIIGVDGERVAGSEGDRTQDFVMVNGPAFLTPTVKQFLTSLKPLAATTDRVPNLKRLFSTFLRATEEALEAGGIESPRIKSLGGHPATHPLGETYFSQAPIRYGRYMAKVALAPVSPNLTALKDAPVDLSGSPDALREAIIQHFAGDGGVWELRVQLCVDTQRMPIEDASVEWSQQDSPYVTVAQLRVAPQAVWNAELARLADDGLQFNPWHALEAHRPLGRIMRARRAVYAMSRRFRAERNGVAIVEPQDAGALRAAAQMKAV